MIVMLSRKLRRYSAALSRAIWRRRHGLALGVAYGVGIDCVFLAAIALMLDAWPWFIGLACGAAMIHSAVIFYLVSVDNRPMRPRQGARA